MKRPSTVKKGNERVIMPLTKIQTTPNRGTIPSTRESARIIGRKLPPLLFFLFVDWLRIGFAVFTPKLVARAVDEDVFQSRLADGDGLNLAGEGLDNVGNEAVSTFALDAHLAAEDGGI